MNTGPTDPTLPEPGSSLSPALRLPQDRAALKASQNPLPEALADPPTFEKGTSRPAADGALIEPGSVEWLSLIPSETPATAEKKSAGIMLWVRDLAVAAVASALIIT